MKKIAIFVAAIIATVCANAQSVQIYSIDSVGIEEGNHCFAYSGDSIKDEIHPLVYNVMRKSPEDFQFVIVTAKDGSSVNSVVEKGSVKTAVLEVERVALDSENDEICLVYFKDTKDPLKDFNQDLLTLNPGQKMMMVEFLGLNHNYHGYLTVPRETPVKEFGPVED